MLYISMIQATSLSTNNVKDAPLRRMRQKPLTLLLTASVFTLIGVIAGIAIGLILDFT
jgi:hypothetical protein